jgi:aryl carrier-like protein
VVIAHRALFNHMRWMLTQFDFTAEDVFLQRTSSSFDASVWEFWAPLLVRGQMIIARQERLYDLDYLIRLIAQHAVSVAQFVPSLLELLLEYSEFCAAPALRWTFAGGEALTAALRRKYFERMRARLCNLYGPTEACIDATFRVCSAADVASTTIGRPIHNTAVTVMNAGELAGIGVAGEICISGAGLFTGYLHAPDLTAQRVFTPRCAPQPHYRTGDLGRLREDGDIEYLGRIDQQVKLHGYRIELSEIDAVLEQQPGVRRAVTVVSSNLLASVVQVDTAQYAADAVLDGARRRLPHYMVPSSLLSIEVLPTLPNGKLDRARLVALVAEQQRAAECAEPENEVQRALLAIWRKVLKQERIGVRDRFFAVGGDSIRSIQVVYEAARAGFEFSVMDLFKHQTISALAQSLQSQPVVRNAAPELENPAPAALRQQFEDAYPATQMQRYMIEAYAADTARHGVFHAQQSLRVVLPAYDVTALARAVAEAADVPTFRTRFVAAQDELYQVLVQRRIAAQIIDLRGASARQQQQRIAELISTDRSSAFDPFDVEAALLRVYLMLLDADSFELCITNHHAIQDGWGHIELLNRICNAYLQPHSAPVSGGNLNSANVNKEFALRQHALLQDAAQVQFWQTQAGQLAVHSVLRATSYRRESQVLSAELMAALEALGRRDNLSHKALFLGAYLATLQQAGLGSVAQAVGVVSNGRSQELSDPLGAIGLFWNLLPFAAEPVTTQLASCCARIQERLIALEPYARFPLRCIEQQAGGRVFAATFNFVNFHNQQRSATARLAAIRGTHALDNFGFPLGLTVGLDAQGSASFLLQLDDSIALSARELCTTFVGQLELLARTATTVTQ